MQVQRKTLGYARRGGLSARLRVVLLAASEPGEEVSTVAGDELRCELDSVELKLRYAIRNVHGENFLRGRRGGREGTFQDAVSGTYVW